MNQQFHEDVKKLSNVTMRSSYDSSDCEFLLKDIGMHMNEEVAELREVKMREGVHYSEMLPEEVLPSKSYLSLFHQTLKRTAKETAQIIGNLSEQLLFNRYSQNEAEKLILVSLARAGTPIGVLMKRYIRTIHSLNLPHYSISIIRGKGIDQNALLHIIDKHQSQNLVFVDGWTGKGAIGRVLVQSIKDFNEKYGTCLKSELAVLADPAHSAHLYGTRDDFFLSSSCLNSIVSGLISRTIERTDLTNEGDFHGAKYYEQWESHDLSNFYIDEVTKYLKETTNRMTPLDPATEQGWSEIKRIQKEFDIEDINKIKPSVGETTRVLLRRVPWKILVKDLRDPRIQHILVLAKEKQIPVEEYTNMNYASIGLIKEQK